jgi:hypothetical protein
LLANMVDGGRGPDSRERKPLRLDAQIYIEINARNCR